MVDDMCIYTSTGVSTQEYENNKRIRRNEKKNFYDTIEERPERASFNHVTAISPGTLRAEMVGGGGVEDGQAEGTTLFIFFFEQFLFW